MSDARLVWTKPTDEQQLLGALVRWREVPRGRWVYAYFRGRVEGVHTFSYAPSGPIVIWSVWREVQVAACVRESQDSHA